MRLHISTRINAVIIVVLSAIAGWAGLNPVPPPLPTEQPWKSGATIVTLSQDGILRVSGKGAMENYGWHYTRGSESPWESAVFYKVAPPITAVVIEEGVTHIGSGALAVADHLVSVTIPSSVTSIGERAFYYCIRLNSVTIPNGVVSIGNNAFRESGLTSVTIPNNVAVIEDHTFYGCTCLTSVTIPSGVVSIENGAFSETRLTAITVGDGVKLIGETAFWRCTSLTSVTIPKSVTSIGWRAFGECTNLKSITIKNPIPPKLDERAFEYISDDATFSIPLISCYAYLTADGWNEYLSVFSVRGGLWIPVAILTTIIILATATFIIIKKSQKPPTVSVPAANK